MSKFLSLAVRLFPTICGLLGLVDRNKDGKITPAEVGATLVDLNRDGKVDTIDLAILLTAAAPVALGLGHPAAAALIADAARRLTDPKSATLSDTFEVDASRWTTSEPIAPRAALASIVANPHFTDEAKASLLAAQSRELQGD